MQALRSNFGDLLEPGFRELFDDRYNEVPPVMDRVFHVNNSTKQDERDSAVTGFGLMQITPEGGPIDYEDPVQMYQTVYTHIKYTKGMRIDVMPDRLIVPVDLRKLAHLIIDSTLRQGTADNDANIYKGQLEIIDWIYMDRLTTHWFLIDSSQHELTWFDRVKPEFKQDDSFDT